MELIVKIETLDIPHTENFKRGALQAIKSALEQVTWSSDGVHHKKASFQVKEVSSGTNREDRDS